VFIATVFLVPILTWLKKYLPKKFKLDETGEALEHLNYLHIYIKKSKYYYKRLAKNLQDIVFNNASLSDFDSDLDDESLLTDNLLSSSSEESGQE
jgi:hypothetical protein